MRLAGPQLTVATLALVVMGLGVARADDERLGKLLARERAWIANPPNLTPDQLGEAFSILRWAIAKEIGIHDPKSAADYALASLNLDPAHPDRWEQLGDLLNFTGEIGSARYAAAAYEKALELEPTRFSARLKLAGACMLMEKPGMAMVQLERCLRDRGDEAEPNVVSLYASACAAANEAARGAAFLRMRVNAGADNNNRIALAVLENAAGRSVAAMEHLTLVERSEGDSPLGIYAANLRKSYGGMK